MQFPSAVYQYSTLTAREQSQLATTAITSGAIATFDATHIPSLERQVASRLGRAGAVAVDSGSAALALAMRGLKIGPGQNVIIPEVGWVSIGTAAAAAGASVTVVPVDATLMPAWEQIEPALTRATSAVVLAHLRGRPASDITRITTELAAREIPLIEDCAQAWDVTADGKPAGARGHVTALSTQTYKMIAVGEGGIVVADDAGLLSFVRAVGGNTREPTPDAVWRGKNRMTEVSAALALPQLAYLPTLTARLRLLQHQLADRLARVAGIKEILPATPAAVEAGNGSITGMWLPTATAAQRLASAYFRAGLRGWWPGPGDLHTADAWPAQPPHHLVDVRCYVDLQTPWLPQQEHEAFCHHVATITVEALGEIG